jgi:catechol 2,3-dioxygenase-like lactoylglutathione lyase family enzyme
MEKRVIHHLAVATKDIAKAHHFYTEVMGFALVKAVKRKAPGGGWTKHLFYDMGDGSLFALWDLRGLERNGVLDPQDWRGGLSVGAGLPNWINHIAFEATDADDFERRVQHWLRHGYHVSMVDHDFIRSAYTIDPDGTMVEWTHRTQPLTAQDRLEAAAILADDSPATEPDYEGTFTRSTAKKSQPEAVS